MVAVYCFISIDKAIWWILVALTCCCHHDRSTGRRRMHRRAHLEEPSLPLLHAQPTVVLGKPHLDIASHSGSGLHLLGHLVIVPSSTDLYVPIEPYGDVVSLLWQDGVQRLRHTNT